ncbi:2,3-bisphosphoglycerate-independent phosphoglycerate mutase, partial [Gemmatimonadota bacterium]
MTPIALPDSLADRGPEGEKIVLFVLDGLGGLPNPDSGRTELEVAHTPHLDALASRSSLGMSLPVAPGITPGSGPGHLALFGYDPVEYVIGRGVLSALGVGFPLEPGDVAVRLNLATLDGEGRVTDRRAGRPSDEEGRTIVERLQSSLQAPEGVEVFVRPVKEHRVVLVLRGGGLEAEILDTDPQATGVPPLPVRASSPGSEETARMVEGVLSQAREVLADEPVINGVLARGFAQFEALPSVHDRFGLTALAIAQYPMYRGVARLVGMDVRETPESASEIPEMLDRSLPDYDFFFLHYKYTDSRGEDGDFGAKVAAIEEADSLVRRVSELEPDVLIVTGDHSTPAAYRAHSWHPVPVLIASKWTRPTGSEFGETTCRAGELGTFEAKHLMTLALAHASRLGKFGA